MDQFNLGNSHYVNEDYAEAIEVLLRFSIIEYHHATRSLFSPCQLQSYTQALATIPNNAELLLNRATAYLKLRKFYEALQVRFLLNVSFEFLT